MKKLIFVVIVALTFTVTVTFAVTGASAPLGPPAPTNLEVVSVSQDKITLAWGPAQPGEFYNAGEGSNYLMVAWGISQDSRGPVTYTLTKDGNTVATGLTTNTHRLSFPAAKKKLPVTFRTCVTAKLADGRSSPPMCATWSR